MYVRGSARCMHGDVRPRLLCRCLCDFDSEYGVNVCDLDSDQYV